MPMDKSTPSEADIFLMAVQVGEAMEELVGGRRPRGKSAVLLVLHALWANGYSITPGKRPGMNEFLKRTSELKTKVRQTEGLE